MRIGDYQASGSLAEDESQRDSWHCTGVDYVLEYGAGTNGRQLVDITDKNQPASRRQRSQKVVSKRRVEHARFIYNEDLAVERGIGIASETELWIVFEKTVYGFCFTARCLRETFSRPAGWCTKKKRNMKASENV